MGALDPIAGISLERYAELCAKMKDCGGDLEVCARIAAENGVERADWEAAMNGWNARMQNPATACQVALAYMPLYQAALATYGVPGGRLCDLCALEHIGRSVVVIDDCFHQFRLRVHRT